MLGLVISGGVGVLSALFGRMLAKSKTDVTVSGPTIRFKDTTFTAGRVGLILETNNIFDLGDWIKVDKDNKALNPQYDGAHQIVQILSPLLIVLDIGW